MTTIVDPSGSPIPVYNRSGQTIDFFTVTGGSGIIAPIISHSQNTICICAVSGVSTPLTEGLELPSNADIGDVVQVCQDSGFSRQFTVYASAGESINGYSSFPVSLSARFIKVSAAAWIFA